MYKNVVPDYSVAFFLNYNYHKNTDFLLRLPKIVQEHESQTFCTCDPYESYEELQ